MRRLLALLLLTCTLTSQGQLDSVYAEVFYTDDGTVAGYPCGFTTYRIYAKVSSEYHRVDLIRSFQNAPITMEVEGGTIFNTIWGATTGDHVNDGYWGFRPEAQYDSFVTLNQASQSEPGGQVFISLAQGDLIREAFHVAPDAVLDASGTYEEYDEGLYIEEIGLCWYQDATTEEVSPVSDDLTVLLAQVTTDGTLSWCLNFGYYEYSEDYASQTSTLYSYSDDLVLDVSGDYNWIVQSDALGLCGEIGPYGCADPTACNYCTDCLPSNNCCIAGGCTDTGALNYDAGAMCDTGGCLYACTLPGDFDLNGIIGASDVLFLLGEFGCTVDCLADLSGDGITLTSDLLILLGNLGDTCDD